MNANQTQTDSHSNRATSLALHLKPLLIVAVLASQSFGDNFFDGPAATPGEPMFFGIFSILKQQKGNFNLSKIAAGGFTTAGPHYHAGNGGDPIGNSTPFYSRIADAAEEGLGTISHITWHPSVINNTSGDIRPNSMSAISEASLRAHVRQVMDFTLNDTQANGTTDKWYTMPEELRPWKSAEMNYLNIVADEVKKHDPLGRPVSMYNPNHRPSSQLNTIIGQGLDETLMGVYVTTVPFAMRGARVADGVNRIMSASSDTLTKPIMGAQLSTDFGSNEITGLRTALGGVSEAEAIKHVIRHDVYQGLLRGIEGVHIWSGHDKRAGLTTFSDQLDGYISVSADMNLGLNLSEVLLHGERRSDFQANLLSGPTTVTHASTTVDTITLSDIAYGDDRYLFLANSSYSPLTISVDGLPPGSPEINDLFTNAPELAVTTSTGQMLLNMEPLEVIGLQIRSISNADSDDDGDVDAKDFLAWQRGFGASGSTTVAGGDFSYDGVVDGSDLSVWEGRFAMGPAAIAMTSAVPEPSIFALLCCPFVVVVAQDRRFGKHHGRAGYRYDC